MSGSVAATMDPEAIQALHAQVKRQVQRMRSLGAANPKNASELDAWKAEKQALQDGIDHSTAQLDAAQKALNDHYEKDESYLSEDSEGSDSSAEDDAAIEGSVVEDMNKFEENFKGIAERYRLIKQIGEGVDLL